MKRSAFTYIEVLAGVLILAVGMFAIIGLVIYGQRLATRAQAQATGLTTAMSIAVDPAPLAASGDWIATAWTRGGYDLTSSGSISCVTSGWVNGLYVVRTESSTAADIVGPGVRSAQVEVLVREANNGRVTAAYTTRIMRQHTDHVTP